jgi:putative transposase
MREIYNAEDIDKAQVAIKAFEVDYGAKYPKAVAKIVDDADVLLEFYKYPAEHWIHLRTTNPIESTFATVRLRTKVTKGPGSRTAGIAMAYKLIDAAQTRWRAVNAPHLVALVRAGAIFDKGKLLERPVDITPTQPGGSIESDVACNDFITGLGNTSAPCGHLLFGEETVTTAPNPSGGTGLAAALSSTDQR